jgi:hypothetical protein
MARIRPSRDSQVERAPDSAPAFTAITSRRTLSSHALRASAVRGRPARDTRGSSLPPRRTSRETIPAPFATKVLRAMPPLTPEKNETRVTCWSSTSPKSMRGARARRLTHDSTVATAWAAQLSRKATHQSCRADGVAYPAVPGRPDQRRLHLTAVSLLASHLTEENVYELVAAAEGRPGGTRQLIEGFPSRISSPRHLSTPNRSFRQPSNWLPDPGPSRRRRPADPARSSQRRTPSGQRCLCQPRARVAPPRFPLRIALGADSRKQYARGLLGHQIPQATWRKYSIECSMCSLPSRSGSSA